MKGIISGLFNLLRFIKKKKTSDNRKANAEYLGWLTRRLLYEMETINILWSGKTKARI